MRVICIDNKPIEGAYNTDLHLLEVGKVYNDVIVCDEAEDPMGNNVVCYIIPELGLDDGWDMKRFLPCSDIDETEVVNHKEEVCQ